MAYYNVVQPCLVGKLHYVRPTQAPIQVDDETAAPLVESGHLEPYRPGHWSEVVDPEIFARLVMERMPEQSGEGIKAGDYAAAHAAVSEAVESGEVEPVTVPDPEPKTRRRRKPTED